MLDTKHSISNLFPASLPDLKSARRLLVLVPNFDINLSAFTSRVWELATATGSSILFLSLVNDAESELKQRRELTSIISLFKNAHMDVQTKIAFGNDWVEVVRENLRVGDMVVCIAKQRTGSLNKVLSETLSARLNTQVYILTDIASQKESNKNWISETTARIGSLAIILGFFFLQVRIIDLTKDGVRTLFLLISLPIGM
ncbi:MAG TPA: hypothetical protein DHW49_14085, partial [Anaerolineae bacterium]|nr:hypothetical protein [Anaerolineae bacterium]